MMNDKGKGTASTSYLSPKDNEDNGSRTVVNEENVIVLMKNEIVEKNKENKMEEEETHEENDMEEGENELDAVEEEDEEENSMEDEDKAGDEEDDEEEEEEGEEEEEKETEPENTEEKVVANSEEKVKRPRKRGRKKEARRGSESAAAKLEDKPGSSRQKKGSKRVESMGLIFMCSSKTKKDCYRYKVLGLPASKREIVQKVYKGMRLFLFDFDLRLMYGIYKAAGPGGYNIEPKAFNSAFPSQVRFTVFEDCLPLPEEQFRTVIKDNYYSRTKFNCQLTSLQVKNLCKLFGAANRSSKSKKSARNVRSETHAYVDREVRDRRSKRQRPHAHEKRRSSLGVDRRYRDRPIVYERDMYERETYESRVAPLPRLQPLPPPSAPSYASYGRPLEMDVYRRDPLVEHRDHRILVSDLRHRDEIGSREQYISYREPPPYRDPLYSVGLRPEYDHPLVEYRPLAGPLPERRHPAPPPPEYTYYRY